MTHSTTTHIQQSTDFIREKIGDIKPKVAIVLGSGQSSLIEQLKETTVIPYDKLPGFPTVDVSGQSGQLVVGQWHNTPVACLMGRAHPYEGDIFPAIKTYVRTLRLLGCEFYLATNASGSLHEHLPPASLMMVNDHINFQFRNPLVGKNDEEFGPRFPPMDKAYHPMIQELLRKAAQQMDISLHEGTYVGAIGPCYETAAEISAFKRLGADIVGMSTIPEVILANHCGYKVGVLSTITNFATGVCNTYHDHDLVLKNAGQATHSMSQLIGKFIELLAENP